MGTGGVTVASGSIRAWPTGETRHLVEAALPTVGTTTLESAVLATFCLGALAFLGTALLVYRRLDSPGARELAVFSGSLGITMALGALINVVGLPTGLEAEFGIGVLTALVWASSVPWLLFAIRYTGRSELMTPSLVGVLAVLSVTYLVSILASGLLEPPQLVQQGLIYVAGGLGTMLAALHVLGGGLVLQTSYRQGNVSLSVSGGFGIVAVLLSVMPLFGFFSAGAGAQWGYLVIGGGTTVAGLLLGGVVLSTDALESTAIAAGAAARERAFLDLADTAFVLDDRQRIVELNDAATETFDLSRREVLGCPFVEVVGVQLDDVRSTAAGTDRDDPRSDPPGTDDHASDEGAVASTPDGAGPPAANGGGGTTERLGSDGNAETEDGTGIDATPTRTITLDTSAGTKRFDVRVSTLENRHGRRLGSVVSFRDVTDRELREQRIAIFNRVLRHNLRNKLSIVQGATDALEQGSGDSERLIAAIDSATDDLLSVGRQAREIEQLLDEEAGRRRSIAVGALVDSAVDDAGAAYPETAFDHSVTEPAQAALVPEVLRYALTELVENAAKHNDAGRPRVEITATLEGETVRLSVADNGPGIPEQERVAIRDDDESPLEHASGLGLWAVRWTVAAVGGDISASTRAEGGTVVELEVPTDRA